MTSGSHINWGRGWFGDMNDDPVTSAAPTGPTITDPPPVPEVFPITFEDGVQAIISKFLTLFLHKHEDYGPGNIMDSALKDLLAGTEYASSAVEWGVLQRLGDKYHRLIHLYAGQSNPNNESLDDSWNDVIGYALVALLVRKGWFSLPLIVNSEEGSE